MIEKTTSEREQSSEGELVRYEMLLHDVYEIPLKLAREIPAFLSCPRCGGSGDIPGMIFHRPGCREEMAGPVN